LAQISFQSLLAHQLALSFVYSFDAIEVNQCPGLLQQRRGFFISDKLLPDQFLPQLNMGFLGTTY
jgi:hypothetical protein